MTPGFALPPIGAGGACGIWWMQQGMVGVVGKSLGLWFAHSRLQGCVCSVFDNMLAMNTVHCHFRAYYLIGCNICWPVVAWLDPSQSF